MFRRKYPITNKTIKFLIFHLTCTKNNILLTVCDNNNKVITSFSMGCLGLKGFKKRTPIAINSFIEEIFFILDEISDFNKEEEDHFIEANYKDLPIVLRVRGEGFLRALFTKKLVESELNFVRVEELSSIPFNGCRPQKRKHI